MKNEFTFDEMKKYVNLSDKKRLDYDNRLYDIQNIEYSSVIIRFFRYFGEFLIAILFVEVLGLLNNISVLYEFGKSLIYAIFHSIHFIIWVCLIGEIINAIIYRRSINKQISELKKEYLK
jgi:hypothetical protein